MSGFDQREHSERCYARIGVMGNPSDGFNGKTLSALIGNFYATVTIKANGNARGCELIPHPKYDPTRFDSLEDLHDHTSQHGYYGGIRLLQATCRVFFDYLTRSGLHERILSTANGEKNGFTMSYDTTIPRCVGLSGSSAIIVAAFRSLMIFHNITLNQIGIEKDVFPSIILSIEKSELNISAGLQDRVIQTYGGLVHMDFTGNDGSLLARAPSTISLSNINNIKPGGVYVSQDPTLLPDMYLAYNIRVGGDSGAVHSTVKDRWQQQEPELVQCMQELGSYADQALQALINKEYHIFCECIDKNFAMRRKIYSDKVVGEKNIEIVDIALKHNMAAKFTGSGGAILMVRNDDITTCGTFYDNDTEEILQNIFLEKGFVFLRVLPVPASV
jgi:glucuronokinase